MAVTQMCSRVSFIYRFRELTCTISPPMIYLCNLRYPATTTCRLLYIIISIPVAAHHVCIGLMSE